MRYGAAKSRRLLVRTVVALDEFRSAVTVIGGDVVIDPRFVTDDPNLVDLMARVGISPALKDRPGIYGFATEEVLEWQRRTTVDLIVPEAYAGPGRRAARIEGQRHAASRTRGLELAIWDRTSAVLTTLDEPYESVAVCVAGPAALLTAKAHKLHQRLVDVISRPDRLKAKDSGDVAMLMMVCDPQGVAQVMIASVAAHPEIADVVRQAGAWLLEMYSDTASIPRQQAVDSLAARFDDAETEAAMNEWLAGFQAASGGLFSG